MSDSDRKAAHAARRARTARAAYDAAPGPRQRLQAAYRWFTATRQNDRTVDAVARQLVQLAERSDARASGRVAATRRPDSRDERLAS